MGTTWMHVQQATVTTHSSETGSPIHVPQNGACESPPHGHLHELPRSKAPLNRQHHLKLKSG